MGASVWLVVALQLCGVLAVIAEVFLPSGGLLSLIAALLFGYSIYSIYENFALNAAVVVGVLDAALIPIAVIVGLKLVSKSPATLSRQLSRKDGIVAQDAAAAAYVGVLGTALTDLRPSGTALLSGKRVDVVSRGEYVPKGAAIVVEEVTGNRVVVRQQEPES